MLLLVKDAGLALLAAELRHERVERVEGIVDSSSLVSGSKSSQSVCSKGGPE